MVVTADVSTVVTLSRWCERCRGTLPGADAPTLAALGRTDRQEAEGYWDDGIVVCGAHTSPPLATRPV